MAWRLSESRITGPLDAYRLFLKRILSSRTQESFYCLFLDTRKRVIGRPFLAARGTVDCVVIHPRDVFREAVRRNAVGVIVAHNHPSGDLEPSSEDVLITRRLKSAGEIVGIPLLDHIVVARGRWTSLASCGMM